MQEGQFILHKGKKAHLRIILEIMDAYRTFLGSGKSEYIINKSRFIARAERISCQKDAETVLAEEKKLYPDATHHCSAYILDPQGNSARFSDDGEPQALPASPFWK